MEQDKSHTSQEILNAMSPAERKIYDNKEKKMHRAYISDQKQDILMRNIQEILNKPTNNV